MISTGKISILLGIIGLIAILYFNYKVSETYDEMGGIGELIIFFIYGRTNKIILVLLQIAGLALGVISGFKEKQTSGRIGFTICTLNLLVLFYQPY